MAYLQKIYGMYAHTCWGGWVNEWTGCFNMVHRYYVFVREEYINQYCRVMDRIRDVELGFRDLHDLSIPGPFPTSPNPFAHQPESPECLRIQT